MRRLSIISAITFLVVFFTGGCARNQQAGKAADSTTAGSARHDSLAVELPKNLQRSDEAIAFGYRFKQGDVFGYKIQVKEHVNITRDTADEKNHQDVEYSYKFRVIKVEQNGDARLEATCLRVRLTGEYVTPGSKRSMTFDSDEKNEPQKQAMFARWNAPVNLPYEVNITRLGEVLSVSGSEAIVKRLMGNDYATAKQKARDMVKNDFENNGLKTIVQLPFQRYNERPVAVDSSWTQSWTGALGFLKLQHTAYYTYKGFEQSADGNIAHIAIRMQSRYTGSDRLDTGQGIATMNGFDVKGSGQTVFHTGRGRCVTRRFNQSVFVKLWVEVPKELKEAAPGQVHDFWLTERATVEDIIEQIPL
jgi:hypothetical protein